MYFGDCHEFTNFTQKKRPVIGLKTVQKFLRCIPLQTWNNASLLVKKNRCPISQNERGPDKMVRCFNAIFSYSGILGSIFPLVFLLEAPTSKLSHHRSGTKKVRFTLMLSRMLDGNIRNLASGKAGVSIFRVGPTISLRTF